MYKRYFKRIFDFVFSLMALIVLMPVITFIAFIVRIKLGSPVIFKQKRPGLDEKIFTLYKFRTMTDAKDKNGELQPDCARLTGFGRFLRSSSLDELPELWNILKGDMSIVGPRPLLKEYLPFYNERQKKRHEVRPGLTGWAQVNGRNDIGWEEKFSFDLEYINRICFLLDIRIVWLTLMKVIKRVGISQQGEATVEMFKGSKS